MEVALLENDEIKIYYVNNRYKIEPPYIKVIDNIIKVSMDKKTTHAYVYDETNNVVNKNYTVVDKTPAEIEATLNKLKTLKINVIKKQFNSFTENEKSYYLNSTVINAAVNYGESHIKNIEQLLLISTDTVEFRLFDNTTVTITFDELSNLLLELLRVKSSIMNRKWSLLKAVEDFNDITKIEELDALNFSVNGILSSKSDRIVL